MRRIGGRLGPRRIDSRPPSVPSNLSTPAATLTPADTIEQRQNRALWAAVAMVVVWGLNFSVQKAVFTALSPGGFLFVRYLIMPACAVTLLLYRFRGHLPRVPREDFFSLLWLGFIGHFVHVGMVTYGIYWSTAFSSSLILALGPIFTLLILRLQGTEKLAPFQVIGVLTAAFGVVVFLSDKLFAGRWTASGGDLVLLVAASMFSYYTVASKRLIVKHGGVVTMAYATLLGSLPVVVFALPAGLATDWTAVSPAIWAGVFWAVIVSAFGGWLVWGYANAVRGVARTAPLMYLMPPVAGLVAWFATGEHFTVVKLFGAAIALAGVALAQYSNRTVREAPALVD